MDHRIQRNPAQIPRRRITQKIRRKRMSRLVNAQRKQKYDELDRCHEKIDLHIWRW
jgi:hypothetical protein